VIFFLISVSIRSFFLMLWSGSVKNSLMTLRLQAHACKGILKLLSVHILDPEGRRLLCPDVEAGISVIADKAFIRTIRLPVLLALCLVCKIVKIDFLAVVVRVLRYQPVHHRHPPVAVLLSKARKKKPVLRVVPL
jgi:hypothetical protein